MTKTHASYVHGSNHYQSGVPTSYSAREKTVQVLILGGTLDSESYKDTANYIETGEPPANIPPREKSLVPAALANTHHGLYCAFEQLAMVDSKDMVGYPEEKDEAKRKASFAKAKDLQAMLEARIRETEQRVVVITMGTDAMAQVARIMQRRLADTDKVLIFTGAMEPLAHGWQISDGPDTLDFVVKTALKGCLEKGAYVGMPDEHGARQLFHVDDALKKNVVPLEHGRNKRFFSGNAVDISQYAGLSYIGR